jgi:CRISPR/Cas system CSM-associated protein Csm5 (group 7 of RAMP superfamily)
MTGTLREDLCTFMVVSRLILLRTRTILDKIIEKIKTHVSCSARFFSENLAVYKTMWKNVVQPKRTRIKIRRMRLA